MTPSVPPVLPALAASALALAAWSSPAAAQEEIHRTALHDYHVETVVEGLVHPWGMAFLPDGDLLVTERPGRLRIVRDGTLLPDPVEGVPAVRAEGQGGLLDVALHPDFEANRLVYLSFSKPLSGGEESTTAVVRGRLEDGRLHDIEEILEAEVRGPGRGHYGSRLSFGPDGYLFVTVGDRQARAQGDLEELMAHPAQDLGTHHGTTLRIHDDGRVPGDNPFIGREGALPEIWSYGHRNAQGMAIHPGTGEVWQTEHGPQGGDELNHVEAGDNHGWPVIGYGVNYRSGSAIHVGTRREGMEEPQHVWVPSIGTSGLMFYTGDAFPAWRGDAFAGGLSGQQLARIDFEDGEPGYEETVLRGLGRVRDVVQGPDGFIYLAIDGRDGSEVPIVRMVPAG